MIDGLLDFNSDGAVTTNDDGVVGSIVVMNGYLDMNGDGLKDILTGKRFWAHGPAGDKEPDAPAVVFWLELRRQNGGQASFVPHLIDHNSGVGTEVTAKDLNGDGRPDVIVGNKKGIFVHLSEPAR